ncbi:MAG: calponin homology domain-containing protein, partial [Olpidium bornovanus]
VLLSHLANAVQPGTIEISKLKTDVNVSRLHPRGTKDYFEVMANLNLCVEGIKKLNNVVVVNVGAEDILGKKADLVLGLVWQLVRAHLFSEVNLGSWLSARAASPFPVRRYDSPHHPELIRLMDPEKENLKDMLKLSEEQILLRWINFHLQRARSRRAVANFGKDLADGECYIALLRQITPDRVPCDLLDRADRLPRADAEGRARLVLEHAGRLGARRFATARDITLGRARLNLGFVATLFNRHIGIRLATEEQAREIAAGREDAEERARAAEERARRLEEEAGALRARAERERAESEAARRSAEAAGRARHEAELAALKHLYESAAAALDIHRRGVEEGLSAALAGIRADLRAFLADQPVGGAATQPPPPGPSLKEAAPAASLADEPGLLRALVDKVLELSKERGDRLRAAQAQLEQSKKVNDLISVGG